MSKINSTALVYTKKKKNLRKMSLALKKLSLLLRQLPVLKEVVQSTEGTDVREARAMRGSFTGERN